MNNSIEIQTKNQSSLFSKLCHDHIGISGSQCRATTPFENLLAEISLSLCLLFLSLKRVFPEPRIMGLIRMRYSSIMSFATREDTRVPLPTITISLPFSFLNLDTASTGFSRIKTAGPHGTSLMLLENTTFLRLFNSPMISASKPSGVGEAFGQNS